MEPHGEKRIFSVAALLASGRFGGLIKTTPCIVCWRNPQCASPIRTWPCFYLLCNFYSQPVTPLTKLYNGRLCVDRWFEPLIDRWLAVTKTMALQRVRAAVELGKVNNGIFNINQLCL